MNYVFLNSFLNSELQYLRHHNFKLGNSVLICRYDLTVRPGMCGLCAALHYRVLPGLLCDRRWRSQMMCFVSCNQVRATLNRRICVSPRASYNRGQRIRVIGSHEDSQKYLLIVATFSYFGRTTWFTTVQN
jgi:hypothetical protein